MTDQPHMDETQPGALKGQEGKAPVITAQPPVTNLGEGHSPADEPVSAKKLSAEEQMALFEKDLKENDWGHQPC